MKTHGKIFRGDCLKSIRKVKSKSIQTVITSPPYWRLRSYDLDDEETKGELGQEETPDEYVANLVKLFSKVKRVLRDDGTIWLNLGDCYNDSGLFGSDFDPGGKRQSSGVSRIKEPRKAPGVKKRDLLGIPWLTAFAMRQAGWYLRADIIWHKKSFMPNSVRNRPMSSHEHIFLLTKNEKYYYDQFAILTPRGTFPRDVWLMGNKKEKNLKHWATFPIELPIQCIKAGTSEHGCCAKCGTPYTRKIKRIKLKRKPRIKKEERGIGLLRSSVDLADGEPAQYRETVGWEKQCSCKTKKIKPCRVLDVFMGSGTTAVAAERLHRRWVGLELYKSNVSIIKNRVEAEITGADYMDPEKKAMVKKIGFGLSKRT